MLMKNSHNLRACVVRRRSEIPTRNLGCFRDVLVTMRVALGTSQKGSAGIVASTGVETSGLRSSWGYAKLFLVDQGRLRWLHRRSATQFVYFRANFALPYPCGHLNVSISPIRHTAIDDCSGPPLHSELATGTRSEHHRRIGALYAHFS